MMSINNVVRIGSILLLFGIGHLYDWREVKYVFSQDLHTRTLLLVNWHDVDIGPVWVHYVGSNQTYCMTFKPVNTVNSKQEGLLDI